MSALYLGTGKLEKYLIEKLDNKLDTNQQIKLNIILDYMRGTRVNNKDNQSSMSFLRPMVEKHVNRNLRIGFWHHPDTGLFQGKHSQGPLREIFGVHHIKAHVFDHNVLITGANLSEDYFTDRQDRYYIIENCEPLANYFDDLISILTDCSYNLNVDGMLKMLPQYPEPNKQPKKFKNQMSHHLRFLRFQHRTQISTQEDLKIEDYFSEDKPQNMNDEDVLLIDHKGVGKPFKNQDETELKSESHQNQIKQHYNDSLAGEEQVLIENSSFSDEYILDKIVQINKKREQDPQGSGRVFIFPTLQMNVINYKEDEELFMELLKFYSQQENKFDRLQLATGYLNLQKEIKNLLNQNKNLKTDLLTSSPRANGFYKAGRFKKFIPGMYRAKELQILQENSKSKNIKIFEWESGEWTYHAKGAWFYEQEESNNPVMTIIGSSNYSNRSNRRDTECQLYILSDSEEFRQKLKIESDHLFSKSKEVSIEHITKFDEDPLTFKERILAKIMNKLL